MGKLALWWTWIPMTLLWGVLAKKVGFPRGRQSVKRKLVITKWVIWKRWKKTKTKYGKLRKYGINHDDAMKSANSRKGYWRISKSEILLRAITTEKLTKWGVKDISLLYERRYLKG